MPGDVYFASLDNPMEVKNTMASNTGLRYLAEKYKGFSNQTSAFHCCKLRSKRHPFPGKSKNQSARQTPSFYSNL